MRLSLPRERFDDRRRLLARLDDVRREVDRSGTMQGADRFQQQAFDVITRGVAEAFDLSQGRPATRREVRHQQAVPPEGRRKWYDMRRSSNLLGKQMLLARRLCEAGCGFVTVSDCGWDMHANGNSPKNMANLPRSRARSIMPSPPFSKTFASAG